MADISEEFRQSLEKRLQALLTVPDTDTDRLYEAARYTVLGGGKRIRAVLALYFYLACGGDAADFSAVTDYAAAVEMIHAGSLIHDDLPAMDNDDMRRGKPSNHKAFGEAAAILAGDALFIHAFRVTAENPFCTPLQNSKATSALSRFAGPDGMTGGQMMDIADDGAKNAAALIKLEALKTSRLIAAACVLGCIAAGGNDGMIKAAEGYAQNMGLAFQIRDDVLDRTGDPALLGKSVSKDENSGKVTFVSLYGVDGADRLCREYTDASCACLSAFGKNAYAEKLAGIAKALAAREY